MPTCLPASTASIDELAAASGDDLTSLSSVGPKIADSVLAFFRQDTNREIHEATGGRGGPAHPDESSPPRRESAA